MGPSPLYPILSGASALVVALSVVGVSYVGNPYLKVLGALGIGAISTTAGFYLGSEMSLDNQRRISKRSEK
jgi:hypothetical protein